MRAIIDGTLPPPPIAQMLGMSLVAVGEGRAVFGLEPDEWMYNPIGSVHGGVAATILDSCMGCAIHTTLPAGVGYTTTDLHVRYTRAMHAGHRWWGRDELAATGETVYPLALVPLLDQLLAGSVQNEPVQLPWHH